MISLVSLTLICFFLFNTLFFRLLYVFFSDSIWLPFKAKKLSIVRIDEFTLLSASWVIRARWREIQRFVRKFKMMKSIHDMQFWVFYFPKKKICTQGCGKINLERMAIVEIILLKTVSAILFL